MQHLALLCILHISQLREIFKTNEQSFCEPPKLEGCCLVRQLLNRSQVGLQVQPLLKKHRKMGSIIVNNLVHNEVGKSPYEKPIENPEIERPRKKTFILRKFAKTTPALYEYDLTTVAK